MSEKVSVKTPEKGPEKLNERCKLDSITSIVKIDESNRQQAQTKADLRRYSSIIFIFKLYGSVGHDSTHQDFL